jgi:glycosyltransferase involved in cell wall biosynthesis
MIYFLAGPLTGHGGGSIAGADILENMLAPERQISVVCPDQCRLPEEVEGNAVVAPRWLLPPPTIRPLSLDPSPRALARRTIARGRSLILRLRVERALRQLPPRLVVHNGFPIPYSFNNEMLDRYSNRLIVVHSAPEQVEFFRMSGPLGPLEWVAERLRLVENLAFVTPQIRDSWSDIAGLTHARKFVIPNTTRESEALRIRQLSRGQLRQALGLPQDAFIVCCVGKVDPAKGQDILVAALPRMVESTPNLHVVFVGRVTRFAEGLPNQVAALGLGDHVTFVGDRDDPYSFIRASDLLIHPSRAEGQGLILLEAMILRTPVLATDVGGIPFAIQHGETGWLVPPENPGALADAFQRLESDPSLRKRLVVGGETRYWEIFSRKRHRERIQSMIETCLVPVA